MKKLRRILVGLDLGPRGEAVTAGSLRAVEQALWLARATGARVTLLHSGARDEYCEGEEGFVVCHEGTSEEGVAALEAVATEFRQEGIKTELVVTDERAGPAMVAQAEKDGTELVLVGKRTEIDSDRRRLGSLSRRMVHDCRADVWVVKPDRDPRPECVLAACELDAVGRRVLETAAWLAREGKAELHVLHASQANMALQKDPDREKLEADHLDRVRAKLAERLEETGLDVQAKLHVGFTSPTHAILEAEKKLGLDLVVMGTVSRGGVAGWVLGNTAERLLDRLDTAILAVKPRSEPE